MYERHPSLQKICGNYKIQSMPETGIISQYLNHIGKEFPITWTNDSPYIKRISLGKFLTSRACFNNNEVSLFIQECKPKLLTLSCREKDVLRSANSKHFSSCLSDNGINQRYIDDYRKDRYLAVMLRRDEAGHILGRAWVRLVRKENKEVFFVYRGYGNFLNPHEICKSIPDFFCEKCVCVSAELTVFEKIHYYDDYRNSWRA